MGVSVGICDDEAGLEAELSVLALVLALGIGFGFGLGIVLSLANCAIRKKSGTQGSSPCCFQTSSFDFIRCCAAILS